MRLYLSADFDLFVYDNMQSVMHTAWSDRYGAKILYMEEGMLTSVEGRRFDFPPSQ